MKICFVKKKFGAEKQALVDRANAIIAKYQAAGYRLTLRQLYYQFVSLGAIPNTEKSYKRLGATVSEGRLAGLLDWNAIEDRGRRPRMVAEFENLGELCESALASYRLPRWQGQRNYVELWVEKDALAGVLWPLAARYHVTLMVNKGYSSQSAMFEAAVRFKNAETRGHERLRLLYLGDHDPSGEDMVRDVRDRLHIFGADVRVEKVALTMEQVREHNPPPNPAKRTDARFRKYQEQHGDESWEVDALPPDVLSDLIRKAILRYRKKARAEAIKELEDEDKAALSDAVAALGASKARVAERLKDWKEPK